MGETKSLHPSTSSTTSSNLTLPSSFKIIQVAGDGNCLFRAISLQIYGDETEHEMIRGNCANYIMKNETTFSPFIRSDALNSVKSYCDRMRRSGVYAGNIEIQAISELYNRPTTIYTPTSSQPVNTFHERYTDPPLFLLYSDGNHYDAIVDTHNPTAGLGLGLPGLKVGEADRSLIRGVVEKSEIEDSEEAIKRKIMSMSDADATADQIEKAILLSTAAEHNQMQKTDFASYPQSPSALPIIQPDNIPPVVQELVFNGYELDTVMRAYDLVGDNFDAILEVIGFLGGDGKG